MRARRIDENQPEAVDYLRRAGYRVHGVMEFAEWLAERFPAPVPRKPKRLAELSEERRRRLRDYMREYYHLHRDHINAQQRERYARKREAC